MKLDREQRLSLVGLRNELFERMASIIEQRRCIISHLEVRFHFLVVSIGCGGSCLRLNTWASDWLAGK